MLKNNILKSICYKNIFINIKNIIKNYLKINLNIFIIFLINKIIIKLKYF